MAVYDPQLAMLEQAVDSILNQTFADFEFLIIDDGSRDPAVAKPSGAGELNVTRASASRASRTGA